MRALLCKKRASLQIKRAFDTTASLFLLTALSPVMAFVAAAVSADSPGGVFFFQTRLTKGARPFKMIKFRTMTENCGGGELTLAGDARVTRIGRVLRKYRLDELPQLYNVLAGDMSFVGPRPEVVRYLNDFSAEDRALFLVRAGVTSRTALCFREEARLLFADDAERVYRERILPVKNAMALEELKSFSLRQDLNTLCRTVLFPVLASLDEKRANR